MQHLHSLVHAKFVSLSSLIQVIRRVPGLKKHASTSTSTTKTRPAGEATSPANKNGRCNGAALLV